MLFLRRAHSPFITNYLKKKQQRCEHIIRKNKQIKSTVHDANKKNEINKDKAWKLKAFAQINEKKKKKKKKEALFKQTELVKATYSIKHASTIYNIIYNSIKICRQSWLINLTFLNTH